MAFPETRLTLIHRIAAGDDEVAWKQFLTDYWRPICLFALRIGSLRWEDAEDVAGQTLQVLSRKELLLRWLEAPEARFKTLVCSVVRNLVSNWVRSDRARVRRLKEYAGEWDAVANEKPRAEDVSAFYGIWADELLRTAVETVMWHYHREGCGDYFRVLNGRICDQQTGKEIASQLGIKVTDAENYYRHARQRLTEQLQAAIRREVERYAVGSDLAEEFRLEWAQLAGYFDSHGGLKEAIRRAVTAQESVVPPDS